MSNLKRYGGWSPEAVASDGARVQELSGKSRWSPSPGENVIRFLPGPAPGVSPFRVTSMHYIKVIPGLDKLLVFACPRGELKQPCPACAKAVELGRSPNPNDRDMARKLQAALRVHSNILDRNNPGAGPQLYTFGVTIWRQLQNIRNSPRSGGDFTDPGPKGFDIVLHKEGDGMESKYMVSAARDATPLAEDDDQLDNLMGMAHDLEAEVSPVVPEELLRFWGEAAMRPQMAAPAQPQRQLAQSGRVGANVVGRTAPSPANLRPEDLDDDFGPVPPKGRRA